MTFTTGRGVNLIELRVALKLRPMGEFDPGKPARVYDNLNERFFDWDTEDAEHYRQTARPFAGTRSSANVSGGRPPRHTRCEPSVAIRTSSLVER
jgi:hypothetical protein